MASPANSPTSCSKRASFLHALYLFPFTRFSHLSENLVEQLQDGTAKFEITSPPLSSPSFLALPFARISASIDGTRRGSSSGAMRKMERFAVERVTGDGRCMFRALVKGMAANKGLTLSPREEREDADDLRMAVKEVICDSDKERQLHKEALVAITVEESLQRYCQRIPHSNFWGGESELLVLSKLCKQPIVVYLPENETRSESGTGFVPIAEYGAEFTKRSNKHKARKPVRLLYSGRSHYDLLI